LVVIAIIALLMGILMPALARVRQLAYRLYCGTNLSGIGKAMLIYSNDYDDELPRAGLRGSTWTAPITDWKAATRSAAFTTGRGSSASITSSFYLLIKYAEVTPKSFLCKGDSGVTEFKGSEHGLAGAELIDLWDFGNHPAQAHCSYSYHIPYGVYALTASSEPGMAIAADANPWLNSPASDARPADQWTKFTPTGDREAIKFGNAQVHQGDGQNVLYMDGHASFEKTSACGVDDDNIYTQANLPSDKKKGTRATAGMQPVSKTDSLLLTDGTK
jgi:prepilin-type processing-associated H-X9-DG protein